ncbi:hypothetical protein, partial [Escherichia coli]|uniref:hypothetical protein n=1 Tax=Escherichia coli TaxID=562 RepID=UPI001BC82F8C
ISTTRCKPVIPENQPITARATVTERAGDQTECLHALVKFAGSVLSRRETAKLRASWRRAVG